MTKKDGEARIIALAKKLKIKIDTKKRKDDKNDPKHNRRGFS